MENTQVQVTLVLDGQLQTALDAEQQVGAQALEEEKKSEIVYYHYLFLISSLC